MARFAQISSKRGTKESDFITVPDIVYVKSQIGDLPIDAEKIMKSTLSKLKKDYLRPKMEEAVKAKYDLDEDDLRDVKRVRYITSLKGMILTYKVRAHRQGVGRFAKAGQGGLKSDGAFDPSWQKGLRRKAVSEGDRPRGVEVLIRNGQSKLIEGAFLAKFKSGHIGVLERTNQKTHTGKTRLSEIQTISVPEMMMSTFDAKEHAKEIRQFMLDTIDKKVKTNIKKYNRDRAKEAAP